KLGVVAGYVEASASARMNQSERGILVPDCELVCRLAAVLDVPSCYLYTLEDDLAALVLLWHAQRHNP
ncbi:transcriptional regulator, partial [Erwinia amylovora]|uniref:transcriptional regulator n=1 Tax=Erwinia amylovora TaxID=552 RepID=UPI000FE335F8